MADNNFECEHLTAYKKSENYGQWRPLDWPKEQQHSQWQAGREREDRQEKAWEAWEVLKAGNKVQRQLQMTVEK